MTTSTTIKLILVFVMTVCAAISVCAGIISNHKNKDPKRMTQSRTVVRIRLGCFLAMLVCLLICVLI